MTPIQLNKIMHAAEDKAMSNGFNLVKFYNWMDKRNKDCSFDIPCETLIFYHPFSKLFALLSFLRLANEGLHDSLGTNSLRCLDHTSSVHNCP